MKATNHRTTIKYKTTIVIGDRNSGKTKYINDKIGYSITPFDEFEHPICIFQCPKRNAFLFTIDNTDCETTEEAQNTINSYT